MSMYEYLSIAADMIRRHSPPSVRGRMAVDPDAIDRVVHAVIVADLAYDRSRGSVGTWRAIFARDAIRKHLRRPASRGRGVAVLHESIADPRSASQLDAMVEREACESRLLACLSALSSLSRPQRACVVLRYIHDRPVRDISRMLDITDSAVNQNIRRGICRMRGSAIHA